MKKLLVVGLIGMSAMLSGCSTVMNGSSDNVTVMMNGTANCTADGKGFMAPSVITLDSSYKDVRISCESPEGKSGETVVTSSVTISAIVGNFFLGGIPGWAVDFGTGNAFNYEPYVTVPMK